jgi:hypothetical protein
MGNRWGPVIPVAPLQGFVGRGISYPGRRYAATPWRLPWADMLCPFGASNWHGPIPMLTPTSLGVVLRFGPVN